MKPGFILLGGEKQSAVSFALAYPATSFLFVSDQNVVDGWDLPNVEIIYSALPDLEMSVKGYKGEIISLSSRYTSVSISDKIAVKEESVFSYLEKMYKTAPEIAIDMTRDFSDTGKKRFLVKGDMWHKPDASQVVRHGFDALPEDIYGCGLFYQEFLPVESRYVSFGRAYRGACYMGMVDVYRESIAREEYIIAAETISDKRLEELSLRLISEIGYEGFFTLNWIKSMGKLFLTSFRPEPRALLATLKKAGLDLLFPGTSERKIAAAGKKMIGDINYASYKPLYS